MGKLIKAIQFYRLFSEIFEFIAEIYRATCYSSPDGRGISSEEWEAIGIKAKELYNSMNNLR